MSSDARTSWALQYRRAFAAIGGPEVDKLMRPYLPDAGFCGFGVTAAWVLKDLWDREQNSPRGKTLFARSDFIDVKARRMARERAAGGFKLVCEGVFSAGRRTDPWSLSKKLASSIQSHADLRKEVYHEYPALTNGPGKEIIARAISEAPDIDGIMLLVKDSAAQNRPFRQTVLYQALQHALTGQRPSSQWRGMQEVFGIPSPELRQKLFALVLHGGALSELAVACLNAIDDIREHYGEAESESRHPDITAGRPWPIITDWCKS
jgi:hypothetical protein